MATFNWRKMLGGCGGCPSSGDCSFLSACKKESPDASAAASDPAPEPAAGGGPRMTRKQAIGGLAGAAVTAAAATGVGARAFESEEQAAIRRDEWDEYFKTNYRLMTKDERHATVARLERLAKHRHGTNPRIKTTPAQEGVLYGYAFSLSRCKGYRHCVQACIEENNLDRDADTHYIRIFEMENGSMQLGDGNAEYVHQVPAEGHFYMGTQCFQCENPPCVEVRPVQATWKEPDGITVIDYDWCIGCRYCAAACPYWARRFNWQEPEVPPEEENPYQHYLGNRRRRKGAMEKCTFCIQRSREGRLPACAEACPNGARIFGNLLDPDSEIRYVLENKQVFRLKEDLGTEPKFWYFMD